MNYKCCIEYILPLMRIHKLVLNFNAQINGMITTLKDLHLIIKD